MKDWNIDICGFTVLTVSPLPTSLTHALLQVLSGNKAQGPSLQVPMLVFLSVHIHYIIVVEIERQTLMDKVKLKGDRFQSCHLVGISSAGSGVSVHNFWERGKPRALSGMLTLSHLLPFNLRVPGPQDGQRGPAVCWVAGSFLQWNLGQCLPQPHGRHHCVHDLQTAWLWGQWNPQHFCCS